MNYHLNASSISIHDIKQRLKIKISKNSLPNMKTINKIANYLKINLRDLLPPMKSKAVKIQKSNENRSWFYHSNSKKNYKFNELTSLPDLPLSKAYELHIVSDKIKNQNLKIPCHQYIFNIGDSDCKIDILNTFKENLNPGDSIYLKPNLKHSFSNKSKLLVLRIGGKVSGDVLYQMSMIDQKTYKD